MRRRREAGDVDIWLLARDEARNHTSRTTAHGPTAMPVPSIHMEIGNGRQTQIGHARGCNRAKPRPEEGLCRIVALGKAWKDADDVVDNGLTPLAARCRVISCDLGRARYAQAIAD